MVTHTRISKGHCRNSTDQDLLLSKFNNEVITYIPILEDKALTSDPLLPSNLQIISPNLDYQLWAKSELYIRVGIGHELLQELRISAGLHSYYSRHQFHSRGHRKV